MKSRSAFPPVFWVANTIEILERFSYYGIYMGFGIYMEYLGYTKAQLGIVQSIFLLLSYTIPIFSGSLADKYGFKKVLIISYIAYLPTILLLMVTKSFSGIALTMLSIGFAAGIFKPLIASTVRVVTDGTNKTLGFGIFYAMVNLGASFGPLIAGKLRAISWNYAFLASAIGIGLMFLVTIFFYKEPPREIEGVTLKQKMNDLWVAISDLKFATFLVLLGIFFWLPFWAFFNLCGLYVDKNLDTAKLFLDIQGIVGSTIANFISRAEEDGTRRILGETIAHTGWVILFLQIPVSRAIEKFRAMPSFNVGLFIAAIGFVVIGLAKGPTPMLIFVGIGLFALGEMVSSPRVQEYITWIAPPEKAGLYMGANFLGTAVGAFLSGITYTTLYGTFREAGNSQYIWYVLAGHMIVAIFAFVIFVKITGGFKEQTELE